MESLMKGFPSLTKIVGKVGREDAWIQGCCVYKNRTKKLHVKISTDDEGRANCRAAMSTSKKCKNLFSRK